MKNAAWGICVLALVGLAGIGWAMMGDAQRMVARDDGTTVRMIGPFEILEKSPKREDKLVLSDAAWKERLTDEQYEILRSKGTEPRFCEVGTLGKEKGVYHCAGCDLALFKSGAKYESGSGWPAFFEPYAKDSVWMTMDTSFGMVRVEVLCSRCDGHLGHVFEDGPADKTGVRFCINSKVLTFKKA